MIFNMNESARSTALNMEGIMESPYALGLEGALMHVYENECNYNALMEAAGLSELKYFQETGKDLFVNEAGALGNFVSKAKALFVKVIEKIKAIAKKFFAQINSFAVSDKDFIKKYEKDLLRADLAGMKFEGYKFAETATILNMGAVTACAGRLEKVTDNVEAYQGESMNDEAMDSALAKQRGSLIGKGELTEAELREEFKKMLYGEGKEEIDVNIRAAMQTISDTSKVIKDVEKTQKDAVDGIDKVIKALEKAQTKIAKWDNAEKSDTGLSEKKNKAVKNISQEISVAKALSNDVTIVFGMLVQQKKDMNRQAKAICVKALSYKKKDEAAVAESGDLFSGVVIR